MLFKNTADKAEAKLRELQQARLKLEGRAIAAEAELRTCEAGVIERSLAEYLPDGSEETKTADAGLPRISATSLARSLRDELAAMPTIRRELMRRIRSAVLALGKARADELRKAAKRKEGELAEYARDRLRLLEALQQFTGARWCVELAPTGPTLYGDRGAILTGERAPVDKGVLLCEELEALRRQADNIEARAAQQTEGGQVAGDSILELLAAIADRPLAPTEAQIRAWYATADAEARREWDVKFPGGMFVADLHQPAPIARVTRYTLCWNDGVIDAKRSGTANRIAPAVTAAA